MVKKDFLACSSGAIKQVCLPVWEAAFFTLVSGVLVGGFVPIMQVQPIQCADSTRVDKIVL